MTESFGSKNVEELRKMILEADEIQSQASFELDYCTKRQEDILHELELEDRTYHERAKLATELQEIRKRRRVAKNQLYLLGPFMKWKDDQEKAISRLSIALGEMRKIEERQQNAVYHSKINTGTTIEHSN